MHNGRKLTQMQGLTEYLMADFLQLDKFIAKLWATEDTACGWEDGWQPVFEEATASVESGHRLCREMMRI